MMADQEPKIQKNSPVVIFAALIASIGGVLFGYDIGIISGALLQLKQLFSLTPFEQELVVSGVLIGAFFASFFGGIIVDSWGRKQGIIVSCGFFIVGSLTLCFSINFIMLVVGRIIVGIAVSLSVTAECTYISEISPPSIRGMMVSLNELGITTGFLLAYLVDYIFISHSNGWKYMFGVAAVPALLQMFGVALMPSSHHYLLIQGKKDQAREVLKSLRSRDDVEEEIETILSSIAEQKNRRYVDLFSSALNMRSRMVLGMALVFLQQVLATIITLFLVDKVGRRSLLLCGSLLMATSIIVLGIVGTVKHSHMIFMNETIPPNNFISESSKSDFFEETINDWSSSTEFIGFNTSSLKNNEYKVFNGSIQNNEAYFSNNTQQKNFKTDETTSDMTEIYSNKSESSADFRTVNELLSKTPNRTYLGNSTYNVSKNGTSESVPFPTKIISVISLMVFVCAYGISYGPVTWLVLSEIFPGSLRGRAISVATCINWGSSIIVSLTFLDILNAVGIGPTFVTYGFICFAAAVFVFFCVPETKSRTLEEINNVLNKGLIRNNCKNSCFRKQREYSVEKSDLTMEAKSDSLQK